MTGEKKKADRAFLAGIEKRMHTHGVVDVGDIQVAVVVLTASEVDRLLKLARLRS